MSLKKSVWELGAAAASVFGIAAAMVWPFEHEAARVRARAPAGARVITLTGVAEAGVWTDEDVSAENYWWRKFSSARLALRAGETVFLQLKSADVLHTFYCPGLGIGPIDVFPGHVEEAVVTPKTAGIYEYYCTMLCADPHFGMRGRIAVTDPQHESLQVPENGFGRFWIANPPAAGAPRTEQGKYLFHKKGCFTCHGMEGAGGVLNYNYAKDTIPTLNNLAEKMFLFDAESAQAVIACIEQGKPIDTLAKDAHIPRINAVLAQYDSIKQTILNGSTAAKKNPQDLAPPLNMPSWRFRLSDTDIDSLIAYFLSLAKWEDEK